MDRHHVSPILPLRLYYDGAKKRKGQSAVDAGGWAWFRHNPTDDWRKAAFHHDLRPALIREASLQGSYRSWTDTKGKAHTRGDCGPWGPDDITSYHPQQIWGLDRAHQPPKNFQFLRVKEAEPTYRVGTWIWRDNVVLDFDGIPMRDFRALPATISSIEDGGFLEGMCREDPRISWKDIRARLPVRHSPMTNPKPVLLATAVAMRRVRYRESSACIAWKSRQGSDDLRVQIEALLPRRCLRANSTRSLTNEEIEAIEEALHKNQPEKAGNPVPSKNHGERKDRTPGKTRWTSKREAGQEMGEKAKMAKLEQIHDLSEILETTGMHRMPSAPPPNLEEKLQGRNLPETPILADQSLQITDVLPEYTNDDQFNDPQIPPQCSPYGSYYGGSLSTSGKEFNAFSMATSPYQPFDGMSHLLDEESIPKSAGVKDFQSADDCQSNPFRNLSSNTTPLPEIPFLRSLSNVFEEEATEHPPS
ncbi:MAG: hypothetical protein Q9184_006567 [Pyrenodesmia sp. 2 TL-2023]